MPTSAQDVQDQAARLKAAQAALAAASAQQNNVVATPQFDMNAYAQQHGINVDDLGAGQSQMMDYLYGVANDPNATIDPSKLSTLNGVQQIGGKTFLPGQEAAYAQAVVDSHRGVNSAADQVNLAQLINDHNNVVSSNAPIDPSTVTGQPNAHQASPGSWVQDSDPYWQTHQDVSGQFGTAAPMKMAPQSTIPVLKALPATTGEPAAPIASETNKSAGPAPSAAMGPAPQIASESNKASDGASPLTTGNAAAPVQTMSTGLQKAPAPGPGEQAQNMGGVPGGGTAPASGSTTSMAALAPITGGTAGTTSQQAAAQGTIPVQSFGPGSDLRFSQINPGATSRTAGTQSMVDNAAQSVAQGTDRATLAKQTLDAVNAQGDLQFNKDLRSTNQYVAAAGRGGSGMARDDFRTVLANRDTQRNQLAQTLALDAADKSLGDRTNTLGALSGLEGQQVGEDTNSQNALRDERTYQYGVGRDAIGDTVAQNAAENNQSNASADLNLRTLQSILGSVSGGDDALNALLSSANAGSAQASDTTSASAQLLQLLAALKGGGAGSGTPVIGAPAVGQTSGNSRIS